MQHEYKDGKIVLKCRYYETARYDASNERLGVAFDGRGGLLGYTLSNGGVDFAAEHVRPVFAVDGRQLDELADKTVEMIGRTQKITVKDGNARIEAEQFISKSLNGVFLRVLADAPEASEFEVSVFFGRAMGSGEAVRKDNVLSVGKLNLCADVQADWISPNLSVYIKEPLHGKPKEFRLFYSFGDDAETARDSFCDFAKYEKLAREEIRAVAIPESAQTEEEKAFYLSSYFCAYENYRKSGGFSAFGAGCRYLTPLRTYFRDSYWTVLSMYESKPEYVREQILTLARGIASDYSCPSAVVYDFSGYWGGHYDSPSFFVLMLYDYVNRTGDFSLPKEIIGGETVLEKAAGVIDGLMRNADETGLLYKDGDFNKRDWADEVNRNGYVSYVEILYIRALYCLSALLEAAGERERAESYRRHMQKVKKSFDEIMWDEEKGYYVNYKYGDFTEDNFSADTLTAVIFGVCDEIKAQRILDNAEKYLDTRVNGAGGGKDFGIMSVYPFYKGLKSVYNKSAQPYDYHNGSNWPYLSAVYAYARSLYGMEWKYALMSWFDYNVRNGNYTPIEYFSPYCPDGSLLQAWSGLGAFVLDNAGKRSFFAPHKLKS